jgi:hypothetical protein
MQHGSPRGNTGWTVTGKLAKVAGSGYIITNVARSKGRVVPVGAAIRSSNIHGKSTKEIMRDIDGVALRAVRRLHQHYRSIHTIGLDIGLDSGGNVWIIEGNFTPALSLFLKLKDKSAYRRIVSY